MQRCGGEGEEEKKRRGEEEEERVGGGGKEDNISNHEFRVYFTGFGHILAKITSSQKMILMRSRAVGIDKRQNGFVNLNIFQFVLLNFFKAIIG